jgi:hypothetical protein
MQKLTQLINDAQNSYAAAPPLTKASDPERFRGSPGRQLRDDPARRVRRPASSPPRSSQTNVWRFRDYDTRNAKHFESMILGGWLK